MEPGPRRGLSALVVLIAAAAVATGCATATPICDAAAPLLAKGQVASAAEMYAHASQAGEGSCADDGLSQAGQAFGRAYSEVAAGADAELSGDGQGAADHYEAALRIDGGNQAAVQGLTRLKRAPVRVETPVTVTPAPTTAAWGWPELLVVIGLLLVAGLGIAATLMFGSRLAEATERLAGLDEKTIDLEKRNNEVDIARQELSAQVAAMEQLAEGHPPDRLGTDLDGLHSNLAELSARAAATERLAKERQHLHDLLSEDVKRVRGDLGELSAQVERGPLDQLRMLLVGTRELAPAGPRRPENPQPVVAWWIELSGSRGNEGRQASRPTCEVLTLLATAMDVDEGFLHVHGFRVEAECLDPVGVLGDESVTSALEVLGASPEDDDAVAALQETLGAGALDPRGRRSVRAPVADPRLLSNVERQFWRSLDGAIVLTFSRHRDDRECVDVLSYLRPDAMATLLETPELAGTLIDLARGSSEDAARDDLGSLMTSAVEDHLLQQLRGGNTPLPRLPPESVLRVDPQGHVELISLEDVAGEGLSDRTCTG